MTPAILAVTIVFSSISAGLSCILVNYITRGGVVKCLKSAKNCIVDSSHKIYEKCGPECNKIKIKINECTQKTTEKTNDCYKSLMKCCICNSENDTPVDLLGEDSSDNAANSSVESV